ncbi:MAG: cytochrome C [Blastocatellia bacterium]|nr:MAG: cytochrome C [Blastocatellia bacterium]
MRVGSGVLVVLNLWPASFASHASQSARLHTLRPMSAVTLVQVPTGRRSVREGVYTASQAKRGKDAYEYSCAGCHLTSLEGDPGRDIPALSGEEFLTHWSNQTVRDLFDVIRKSMPADSAGSLRAETYIDIVAYLLQSNHFPSGEKDLTSDSASLGDVVIDKSP